jgi:hypothetical protein
VSLVKESSASSQPVAQKSMTTEDIRSRHWTDAEKQVIRRASEARAAALDLPDKEIAN